MKAALKIIQECLSTKNKLLYLNNSGISNNSPEIELLKKCNHITTLNLSNNNLKIITDLSSLTNLKKLDLNGNKIEKIENLEGLKKLNQLDLSFNKINKTEGLESLLKLKTLNLQHNLINKISGFDKLKSSGIKNSRLQYSKNLSVAALRCIFAGYAESFLKLLLE